MQQISAQEFVIMEAIWDAGEGYLTTRDIESRLFDFDGKKRNLSSLMTVIARLVEKGYLEPVKKYRRSTYFVPLIQEREYKIFATLQFIDSIHNGKLSEFMAVILDSGRYSQQDFDELHGVIDEKSRS